MKQFPMLSIEKFIKENKVKESETVFVKNMLNWQAFDLVVLEDLEKIRIAYGDVYQRHMAQAIRKCFPEDFPKPSKIDWDYIKENRQSLAAYGEQIIRAEEIVHQWQERKQFAAQLLKKEFWENTGEDKFKEKLGEIKTMWAGHAEVAHYTVECLLESQMLVDKVESYYEKVSQELKNERAIYDTLINKIKNNIGSAKMFVRNQDLPSHIREKQLRDRFFDDLGNYLVKLKSWINEQRVLLTKSMAIKLRCMESNNDKDFCFVDVLLESINKLKALKIIDCKDEFTVREELLTVRNVISCLSYLANCQETELLKISWLNPKNTIMGICVNFMPKNIGYCVLPVEAEHLFGQIRLSSNTSYGYQSPTLENVITYNQAVLRLERDFLHKLKDGYFALTELEIWRINDSLEKIINFYLIELSKEKNDLIADQVLKIWRESIKQRQIKFIQVFLRLWIEKWPGIIASKIESAISAEYVRNYQIIKKFMIMAAGYSLPHARKYLTMIEDLVEKIKELFIEKICKKEFLLEARSNIRLAVFAVNKIAVDIFIKFFIYCAENINTELQIIRNFIVEEEVGYSLKQLRVAAFKVSGKSGFYRELLGFVVETIYDRRQAKFALLCEYSNGYLTSGWEERHRDVAVRELKKIRVFLQEEIKLMQKDSVISANNGSSSSEFLSRRSVCTPLIAQEKMKNEGDFDGPALVSTEAVAKLMDSLHIICAYYPRWQQAILLFKLFEDYLVFYQGKDSGLLRIFLYMGEESLLKQYLCKRIRYLLFSFPEQLLTEFNFCKHQESVKLILQNIFQVELFEEKLTYEISYLLRIQLAEIFLSLPSKAIFLEKISEDYLQKLTMVLDAVGDRYYEKFLEDMGGFNPLLIIPEIVEQKLQKLFAEKLIILWRPEYAKLVESHFPVQCRQRYRFQWLKALLDRKNFADQYANFYLNKQYGIKCLEQFYGIQNLSLVLQEIQRFFDGDSASLAVLRLLNSYLTRIDLPRDVQDSNDIVITVYERCVICCEKINHLQKIGKKIIDFLKEENFVAVQVTLLASCMLIQENKHLMTWFNFFVGEPLLEWMKYQLANDKQNIEETINKFAVILSAEIIAFLTISLIVEMNWLVKNAVQIYQLNMTMISRVRLAESWWARELDAKTLECIFRGFTAKRMHRLARVLAGISTETMSVGNAEALILLINSLQKLQSCQPVNQQEVITVVLAGKQGVAIEKISLISNYQKWINTLKVIFVGGKQRRSKECTSMALGKRNFHPEIQEIFLQKKSTEPESDRVLVHLPGMPSVLEVNFYPVAVATELAVRSLHRLTFNIDMPYAELTNLTVDSVERAVFINQIIPGKSLMQCWHEKIMLNIDKMNFSRQFLSALLTNPGNGTPQNVVVKTVVTQEGEVIHQLFPTDNSQAFCASLSKNKLINAVNKQQPPEYFYYLNIKTVIFCFDEMYEPLQQEVIEEVLNANIYCLLKSWLIELIRQNIQYQQLFNSVQCENLPAGQIKNKKDNWIELPEQLVSDLYLKLLSLKKLLIRNSTMRAIDLLLSIYPELSPYYLAVLQIAMHPVQRFNELIKRASLVVHHERDFWRHFSVSIDRGVDIERFIGGLAETKILQEIGPKKALKRLAKIHNLQQEKTVELTKLLAENKRHTEGTIAFYDMQSKEMVSVEEKCSFYINGYVYGGDLYELDLQGCYILRAAQLLKILQNFQQLGKFNLSDCQNLKLSEKNILSIGQICRDLYWLSLSRNNWLGHVCISLIVSSPLSAFSALKYLDVSFCQQLRVLKLQLPQLQNLQANNCANLIDLMLESKNLFILSLNECSSLSYQKAIVTHTENLIILKLRGSAITQAEFYENYPFLFKIDFADYPEIVIALVDKALKSTAINIFTIDYLTIEKILEKIDVWLKIFTMLLRFLDSEKAIGYLASNLVIKEVKKISWVSQLLKWQINEKLIVLKNVEHDPRRWFQTLQELFNKFKMLALIKAQYKVEWSNFLLVISNEKAQLLLFKREDLIRSLLIIQLQHQVEANEVCKESLRNILLFVLEKHVSTDLKVLAFLVLYDFGVEKNVFKINDFLLGKRKGGQFISDKIPGSLLIKIVKKLAAVFMQNHRVTIDLFDNFTVEERYADFELEMMVIEALWRIAMSSSQMTGRLLALLRSKKTSLQLKSVVFLACCKQAILSNSQLLEKTLDILRDDQELFAVIRDQKVFVNRHIPLDTLYKLNNKENVFLILNLFNAFSYISPLLKEIETLFKLNFNDRFVKLVVNILKLCLKNIDDSVFINICKEAVKKNERFVNEVELFFKKVEDFLLDTILNETIKEEIKFKMIALLGNMKNLSQIQLEKLLQLLDTERVSVDLRLAVGKLLIKHDSAKKPILSKSFSLAKDYVSKTSPFFGWFGNVADATVLLIPEIADLSILLKHELASSLKTEVMSNSIYYSWTKGMMSPLGRLPTTVQSFHTPSTFIRLSNIHFWQPVVTKGSLNNDMGNIFFGKNATERSSFMVENSW